MHDPITTELFPQGKDKKKKKTSSKKIKKEEEFPKKTHLPDQNSSPEEWLREHVG